MMFLETAERDGARSSSRPPSGWATPSSPSRCSAFLGFGVSVAVIRLGPDRSRRSYGCMSPALVDGAVAGARDRLARRSR